MPHHIFFSWQSDTPSRVGRALIQTCLERAIDTLREDVEIDPAHREIAADRDTLNVPGSPPIMETIFAKIDRASIFLSDLTYVTERAGDRRSPNPNVCIEHGYALKNLSWRRLVAVMNTAMGHPDEYELPFDLRHTRRPILFHCPDDVSSEVRKELSVGLTKQLTVALKSIFADEMALRSMRDAVQAKPDERQPAAEQALSEIAYDGVRGQVPQIVTYPRLVLRLAPFAATNRPRLDSRRVTELRSLFPPNVDERVINDSDSTQWWSYAPSRRLVADSNLNPETAWLMRLVRPGNIEFQINMGQRIGDDPQIFVDGRRLEALVVHNLERMAAVAVGLGLNGPGLASVSLEGVEDVELTRARPEGRRIRQPQIHFPTAKLADLESPLATSLREQLDCLWQASGWSDGSPSFPTGQWAGYKDQHNYRSD